MIKVNEVFSGIGAFRKALIRMSIPHEVVGISEIDKYAILSYEAIYGTTRNYGDISKVDNLDYADLWTYGFPCQDISSAGKQRVKSIIKSRENRNGFSCLFFYPKTAEGGLKDERIQLFDVRSAPRN